MKLSGGKWKLFITPNAIFNMNSFKSTILLFVLLFALSCEDGSNFQFDDVNVSSSGSIAKFYIDQNYLYVVENNALIIFDISDNTLV